MTEGTVRAAATHCPYCALQCAMTVSTGSTIGVEIAGRDFPTNRGGLCKKGWTAAELIASPERIAEPMVREASGDWTRTTFTNVDLNRRYSPGEQAKFFTVPRK